MQFRLQSDLRICEGVLTWLIREGNYGDLTFSKDLAVVLIIHWEGNVFEKNREFGFLIDDRANLEERVALEKIFTGYAGGAFEAWRDLTLHLDGVQFVPMTVTHDAENWRVEVPGMVGRLGWRPILSTYGVRSIVRSGQDISCIDHALIASLRDREVDGAIVRPLVPYKVGQSVKIAEGPFDGLVATIIDMDEKDRLVVLLDLMNRSTKVMLGSQQVMAA